MTSDKIAINIVCIKKIYFQFTPQLVSTGTQNAFPMYSKINADNIPEAFYFVFKRIFRILTPCSY